MVGSGMVRNKAAPSAWLSRCILPDYDVALGLGNTKTAERRGVHGVATCQHGQSLPCSSSM